MVMERIDAIPVNDLEQIRAHGIDTATLGRNGVEIFFTQVFRDGFFHADMHPGNIFVARDGRYCGIDYGIMGSLPEVDKNCLAMIFIAFFRRDYKAVAVAHIEAGWVPADTGVEEFEGAIRSVCEPIFDKPLKDIYFGKLLLRLFEVGAALPHGHPAAARAAAEDAAAGGRARAPPRSGARPAAAPRSRSSSAGCARTTARAACGGS